MAGGPPLWVDTGSPVTAIREVDSETGEQKFVSESMVRRRGFLLVSDEAERKRQKDSNDAMEAGDPRIEWKIGCKSQSIL